MKLRPKLLAVVAVPLILSICLGAIIVRNNTQDLIEAKNASRSLKVMEASSSLIAQIQDERGKTSLFMIGAVANDDVVMQRVTADSVYSGLIDDLHKAKVPEEDSKPLSEAVAALAPIRTGVDTGGRSESEVSASYTKVISDLTGNLVKAAATCPPEYQRSFMTILSLESAKEFSARIRTRAAVTLKMDGPLSAEAVEELTYIFPCTLR